MVGHALPACYRKDLVGLRARIDHGEQVRYRLS